MDHKVTMPFARIKPRWNDYCEWLEENVGENKRLWKAAYEYDNENEILNLAVSFKYESSAAAFKLRWC